MPRIADQALPLQHWCVLSLRPRGQHASLRAAAARSGARTLALSPFAIEARVDPTTRRALAHALAADIVLYTSPNAVAAAAALRSLKPRRGQVVLAVGSGTRRALRRHGVDAGAPSRMDSEGLLAMPELAEVGGRRIGLVTGSGGRGMLAQGRSMSALGEDTSMEGVAGCALWLLSDLGFSTTGEIVHVDAGFHMMGLGSDSE